MSMHAKSIPAAWVERLFARFTAIYGAQKVAAMWAVADGTDSRRVEEATAAVKAEWAQQLGRFNGGTIAVAVQAVIDSGRQWPPTLPEFVAICRDYARPEAMSAQLALPAVGKAYTDAETARANLAKVRGMLVTAVKRVPA